MKPRIIGVLAASVLLTACVNILASVVGESVGVPLGDKVVSSKVEPIVLVAIDGATCTVSKARWEKARVGEGYFCNWSTGE